MHEYTSLDAPDHGDTTKYALDRDHKDLVYKLSNSNDFTFSFAREDLNEFAHRWGFENALDVVKESKLTKDFEIGSITQLYSFVRNHSDKHGSDLETLVQYLLGRI